MTIRKASKLLQSVVLGVAFAVVITPGRCPAQQTSDPAESAQETPAESNNEQQPDGKKTESKNPRRPETYQEALSAAGDDGIIIFCYGPDWNQRSLRMLQSFWMKANLEKITGQAQLLAVPIYESPNQAQADEQRRITAGMPSIPFSVCPTIMLVDKDGNMYANLPGMDFLGDEDGTAALNNITQKLQMHRKMLELLQRAGTLQGVEKAKVLGEVAELPIQKPADLLDMIKEADPSDSTGLARRNEHSALQFLYQQMDTKDGFLKADFHTTLHDLMQETMKIVNDTALRPEDRQAAYCLLIGQARREEGGSKRMKAMIAACMKIDPKSFYGRAMSQLAVLWGNERANETSDERRARRAKEKDDEKKRRQREREVKKTERNTTVK